MCNQSYHTHPPNAIHQPLHFPFHTQGHPSPVTELSEAFLLGYTEQVYTTDDFEATFLNSASKNQSPQDARHTCTS